MKASEDSDASLNGGTDVFACIRRSYEQSFTDGGEEVKSLILS